MAGEIKGAEVLVVGGGVIGCAVARSLAARGVEVALLERGTPGMAASWAAAGMLTPQGEGRAGGPFLDLCMSSLSLYPDFAAELQAQTGLDPAFRRMGTLVATRSPEYAAELQASLPGHVSAGADVRWLSTAEAVEIAPALHPGVLGGLWFPDEGQVDNRALGRALWAGAVESGVTVRTGTGVTALETRGAAVAGVRLEDGRSLGADVVVLAGGAWSGGVRCLPHPLSVRPVRGQMLALETVPAVLPCLLSMDHVYLVPRTSGRTLVGATLEEAGFRDRTTAAGIAGLLQGALDAIPTLADAAVLETWSGLRPGTPDELPILGPDPTLEGLQYATGHYRNGILLTPVTAQALADAVTGATPAHDLTPYRVDRFLD
jgi:glycine oxidase